MKLTPTQIGEMLGQQLFILWERCERKDLDTIHAFTDIDVPKQVRILEELQYLRIFSMDYGATVASGGMNTIRNQVLDGFLECLERDEIGSCRIYNITLTAYNSRAMAYAKVVGSIRSDDGTSLIRVGGAFCEQCGLSKRLDIAGWAVIQFVGTQKLAREIFQTCTA